MINEVKIYKPYRKTEAYEALNNQERVKKMWLGENLDRLILDRVISTEELLKRENEAISKIAYPKDKTLTRWRWMEERPTVICQNPSCRKETVNLSPNSKKYYCSTTCGMAFRDAKKALEKKGIG